MDSKRLKNRLYREIKVWKRISQTQLALFRCFELIPRGGFCVQSVDYFNTHCEKTYLQQFEHSNFQFLELLLEEEPKHRSKFYPTIISAIEAFDADFLEDE